MKVTKGERMTYGSFEQVARLGSDAQEQLLQEGDAVERVWAAWALGLQRGVAANPQLLASLHESPAPGTRRQLLVILAGLGERRILQTFAQDDPDEFVRATACQYLIRTGDAGDVLTQAILLDRLLHDDALVVRQTILEEVRAGLPLLQTEHLALLVSDPELEVRQLAVDQLLAIAPSAALFPGALENRIPLEKDADLRHQLVELCIATGGAPRLLVLATTGRAALQTELLTTLIHHHLLFQWDALMPLIQIDDLVIDRMVLQLLDPADALQAFSWLLMCVASPLTWPEPHTRAELERQWLAEVRVLEATTLLCQAAIGMQPGAVQPSEHEMIYRVITEIELLEHTAARGVMDDWDYETGAFVEIPVNWYADPRVVEQLGLLRELRRLVT